MFNDIIIACKGNSKEIKKILEFLQAEIEDEVVLNGKQIGIAESYELNSVEDIEDIIVKIVIAFPNVSFKLTAIGDEKDYQYNIQITYDGKVVKSSNSHYYKIVIFSDEIATYDDYQKSGMNLKLTETNFNEIKSGTRYIYNIRPDAKKPKLSLKLPMNEERVIFPKKRTILGPVESIGPITTSFDKTEYGTTIIAEMVVEYEGKPLYFLEMHYDTMMALCFSVTDESVRFFWEKRGKQTEDEQKLYERIMVAAIEDYDNYFDFLPVYKYDGVFKKQLLALHEAIEKEAKNIGVSVTSSWEIEH